MPPGSSRALYVFAHPASGDLRSMSLPNTGMPGMAPSPLRHTCSSRRSHQVCQSQAHAHTHAAAVAVAASQLARHPLSPAAPRHRPPPGCPQTPLPPPPPHTPGDCNVHIGQVIQEGSHQQHLLRRPGRAAMQLELQAQQQQQACRQACRQASTGGACALLACQPGRLCACALAAAACCPTPQPAPPSSRRCSPAAHTRDRSQSSRT
jgi:hypothetical protein